MQGLSFLLDATSYYLEIQVVFKLNVTGSRNSFTKRCGHKEYHDIITSLCDSNSGSPCCLPLLSEDCGFLKRGLHVNTMWEEMMKLHPRQADQLQAGTTESGQELQTTTTEYKIPMLPRRSLGEKTAGATCDFQPAFLLILLVGSWL